MLDFLMSKLGLYLVGSLIIAALVFGGKWYVGHLQTQVKAAETRAEVAEANLKVAEKTIKILKEYQDVDEVIENADDSDVIEYLRTGVWPKTGKAGNSSPAVPGDSQTGKSGKGPER